MNPEVQRLLDTINRLMAKGMPRDDETIKTLEGLIEQELSKAAPDPTGRNMDFMQMPRRGSPAPEGMAPNPPPEVGRPTYKKDDAFIDPEWQRDYGHLSPEELQRRRPEFMQKELDTARQTLDAEEQRNMMAQPHILFEGRDFASPFNRWVPSARNRMEEMQMMTQPHLRSEEPYKFVPRLDPDDPSDPQYPFTVAPQQGFKDMKRLLRGEDDEESGIPDPTREIMGTRKEFKRPGITAEEELDLIQKGMGEDEEVEEDYQ